MVIKSDLLWVELSRKCSSRRWHIRWDLKESDGSLPAFSHELLFSWNHVNCCTSKREEWTGIGGSVQRSILCTLNGRCWWPTAEQMSKSQWKLMRKTWAGEGFTKSFYNVLLNKYLWNLDWMFCKINVRSGFLNSSLWGPWVFNISKRS